MVEVPKAELLPLAVLKVDDSNPNAMTEQQIVALSKNIERFGFIVPIITNEDLLIADGEHRLKAAERLGMSEVPVIVLPLKEVDRKILRQVLNKLKGSHDEDLDLVEFRLIQADEKLPELAELMAIPVKELQSLIDADKKIQEDDFETEVETDIKQGEVFELGTHRLMCGDATKKEEVEKLVNGKEIELLLTDPPYGIKYNTKGRMGAFCKGKDFEPIIGDSEKFNPKHLLNYNKIILWGANYYCHSLPENNSWIVWDKREGVPSDNNSDCELAWTNLSHPTRIISYLWKGAIKRGEHGETRMHPTQKPIAVMSFCINLSVVPMDGIILDLYGGSGSTLMACEQLNRKCYMMELDPKYCQVIINRWEKLTNKKAKQINS